MWMMGMCSHYKARVTAQGMLLCSNMRQKDNTSGFCKT